MPLHYSHAVMASACIVGFDYMLLVGAATRPFTSRMCNGTKGLTTSICITAAKCLSDTGETTRLWLSSFYRLQQADRSNQPHH